MDDDDEVTGPIGPPPPVPVKKVRADALRRATIAWTARVSGATWREAAEMAGFSDPAHAMESVRNAFGGPPVIDREAARHLWRERLERTWRQVLSDMSARVPGSTTAAVRITTAAIALDALAAPVTVDLRVTQVFDGFLKELSDAGYLES